MREKDSKQLVIDTDVVRRSGGQKATYPAAKNCRDFLSTVTLLSYHVVITPDISKEWDKHASTFARRWWVSMERRNRMCDINPLQDKKMCRKILRTARSNRQKEKMEKDFHLLNAALATDQTIISCEKEIRKFYARASEKVSEIQEIIWVNPERTAEERSIDWLNRGAPAEECRKLSNFIPY